jgi:signal transduction histidine kinase/DNA-binding NarL/FixJ family response regulator/HPt (histidine-containing phosphotransfer) domain-containing protein
MKFFVSPFLLLFVAIFMLATPTAANVELAAVKHLDLAQAEKPIYIGSYMIETLDPESTITAQNIVNQHRSRTNNISLIKEVVNFGVNAAPRWLSFEVTNLTDVEYWSLSLGQLFEGRMGKITAIEVYNATRNQVFIKADTIEAVNNAMVNGAFPLRITPGKTELIIIRLKPLKTSVASFKPNLIPQALTQSSGRMANVLYHLISISLFLSAGFFIALAWLKARPVYLATTVYFLLMLAFMALLQSSPAPLFLLNVPILWAAVAIFIVLSQARYLIEKNEIDTRGDFISGFLRIILSIATLFAIIPLEGIAAYQMLILATVIILSGAGLTYIFISQSRQSPQMSLMHALPWFVFTLGVCLTTLEVALFHSGIAFFINACFYALIPQGFFLIRVMVEQSRRDDDRKIGDLSHANRIEQELIKIQKNKENEEQSRLLRVIERERELMAELREKEAQRTEEMRKARDEADRANKAKSAFLAVISHEIRTPMNGIMGVLRLLQRTHATEEQSDYILTMQKTGDTMVALLNDILDFEKIETGAMQLEHINIDLYNMIRGIVTLMHGYVSDKNIELKSNIAANVPQYVIGDPTRLRQVLLNLVSNAIKFTEEGSVTIKLESKKITEKKAGTLKDHEITFSVIDTGVGIPEEAQATLFEPFQQADTSVARKYGGSGLGLTISMRLVQIMGSSIQLVSKAGEGSKFSFLLPMEEGYGEEKIIPTASSKKNPLTASQNILVIEDNETNRKVLRVTLEQDGHRVSLANTAEQGIDMLQDQAFDMVLLDINLPGMNGLEATKLIRTMKGGIHQSLPLIAISGNVTEKDIEEARISGMNALLGKPIDYDHLDSLISQISKGQIPVMVDPAKEIDNKPHEKFESDDSAKAAIAPSLTPTLENNEESLLYDIIVLKGLYSALGEEVLRGLLDDCYLKIAETMILIEESFNNKPDANFIFSRMHDLKGMCYNFGLKAVGDAATQGEKAGRSGDMDEAKLALDQMKNVHGTVKDQITQWLDEQVS